MRRIDVMRDGEMMRLTRRGFSRELSKVEAREIVETKVMLAADAGASLRAIADYLGVSRSFAHTMTVRARRKARFASPIEKWCETNDFEHIDRLERKRLRRILRGVDHDHCKDRSILSIASIRDPDTREYLLRAAPWAREVVETARAKLRQ